MAVGMDEEEAVGVGMGRPCGGGEEKLKEAEGVNPEEEGVGAAEGEAGVAPFVAFLHACEQTRPARDQPVNDNGASEEHPAFFRCHRSRPGASAE